MRSEDKIALNEYRRCLAKVISNYIQSAQARVQTNISHRKHHHLVIIYCSIIFCVHRLGLFTMARSRNPSGNTFSSLRPTPHQKTIAGDGVATLVLNLIPHIKYNIVVGFFRMHILPVS